MEANERNTGAVGGVYHSSAPLILWLPALLVGLAMLIPLLYLGVRGGSATQEAWELLFRMRTVYILGRSILLVVAVTSISITIAVPVAWLVVKTDLPFRSTWSVLTALPLVIPSYVGAFLAVSALGPKGLLQQALYGPLGVDRLPDIYGLPGAAITLSLLSFPYILLTVRGAIVNLDPSLEESARSLGHGAWSTALRVVLPQLYPSIASGSLLVALYTLSDFGAVSLLRYETFTWVIYQQYLSSFDRSIAALMSLVLVALAVVLLLMEACTRRRRRYYRSSPGTPLVQRIIRLGRWKWPALAFCIFITLASLVLPITVLSYWLVRGVSAGEPLLLSWDAMRNSLYVSILAAIAAGTFSIPVALMIVRYPGTLSRVVERVSFVGYALPGVVVALSLVFFGIRFVWPLYQTVWLLVFAYVVLFLPAALGAVRSSVLQISPRLEEAARSLGRKPHQAILSVTVPLMSSGVLMGSVLVFLVAMKELPATLILGPIGFNTLATNVWSASSEAFFAQAAAPALALILLSSVPMALLVVRERRIRE